MNIENANDPGGTGSIDTGMRRRRLQIVAALFLGSAIIFALRLAFIQVVEADHFRQLASEEHFRRTIVAPRRGDISDSTGHPLATTVNYRSLYASTSEISDARGVASRLAPLLVIREETLLATLSRKQVAPTLLKRWLSEDDVAVVQRLALDGLFFQSEPKRAYPQGALLDQVLGVPGYDDNGLGGLELGYDSVLAGKPGSLVAERDSGGDPIALGPRQYEAPVDGGSLVLTIDRYVQWVAERELAAAMSSQHATSGTIVVLDPRTGAVVALASLPTFHHDDPDVYSASNVAMYNVPSVAQAAEPGISFRFVVLAVALETGIATPSTSFFNSGTLSYVGHEVRDGSARVSGPMTMNQALRAASTVGLAWMATKVGAPKFYRIVNDLGFGQRSGIDLPGEAPGFVRQPTELDWDPYDLVNNSFGQGIISSPLQLASAVATVANGGVRMRPFIVQRVVGSGADRSISPTVDRRVLRGETATTSTQMLVSAVDSAGTDPIKDAQVPGYAVAGMGAGPIGAGEMPTAMGSLDDTFVGFAPAERPRFVIYVRLDGPPSTVHRAPLAFGTIARQLMGYYQIPPSRQVAVNGT